MGEREWKRVSEKKKEGGGGVGRRGSGKVEEEVS